MIDTETRSKNLLFKFHSFIMQHLVCTMKNYYVNDSDKHRVSLSSLRYTGAFPWFSPLTWNERRSGNYFYLGNVSLLDHKSFSLTW